MNCPYCKTPIDEHEASRCLDAWFLETVMGKLCGGLLVGGQRDFLSTGTAFATSTSLRTRPLLPSRGRVFCNVVRTANYSGRSVVIGAR